MSEPINSDTIIYNNVSDKKDNVIDESIFANKTLINTDMATIYCPF